MKKNGGSDLVMMITGWHAAVFAHEPAPVAGVQKMRLPFWKWAENPPSPLASGRVSSTG